MCLLLHYLEIRVVPKLISVFGKDKQGKFGNSIKVSSHSDRIDTREIMPIQAQQLIHLIFKIATYW